VTKLTRCEARKYFFFEKKKQKTFAPLGHAVKSMANRNEQKFFGSFFQKRTAFLALACFSLS
jgi:hypothetical protein